MIESSEGARRGRPPGEETPESLIRKELIQHLKLYKRTREIVEKRLSVDGLDVDELTKYMELLRKGIVEMSKPIIPQARAEAARPVETEEDPEALLQRILSGEKK